MRQRYRWLATLVAVLAGASSASAQSAPAPMTIATFLAVHAVSDPQPSPDGRLLAFTVSTPSLEEDRNQSRIWLADLGSGDTWEATSGAGSERSPRWSADGKTLSYISTREDGAQIWQLPIRGGEPTRISSVPGGIGEFLVSPGGKAMFYVKDVPWPVAGDPDLRHGPYPTEAKLWSDLFYRHWNEWRVGVRQHLFRLEPGDSVGTDITPFDRDVPTLALGGVGVALSQFGTEVAVVYNPDSSLATSTNNDIFVMGPDGTGKQAITTSPANDNSPAYSPDSRYVAYLAMTVPGFEADRQQVMIYERATGRRRALTAEWTLSVDAITWTPDSRALIAEVPERGGVSLYRIEAATGRRSLLVSGGMNTSVRVPPRGDDMVFLRSTADRPTEVWAANWNSGAGLRQVTTLNDEWRGGVQLTPLEPFGFVGALGDSVFGWLMKPPGFDPAKKYPVVYLIHGGPQGAWNDEWHPRWNYAMFAARGYVVAAVNFHGSTGYGQAFTNSISLHWGDYPYEDLMKGLDVVTANPWVDSNRVGAAGASYGGYMIYWMAGQTNRFRTLVAHDGIFNPVSFTGTTEELWYPIHEFGGTPLMPSARATMEKWSPANYTARWQTPMLIVHGQEDYRVDVSEGFQAYTALRLRGLPGKFLYFPNEGHFVLRPRDRRLWWGTVLDWLDASLRPTP
ncbi:MAG TPA: S9 family peptidase [Gemmatimonadales bacterium]|nr:S9 family peptidase [Gemmatimonadales bacterium]